MKEIWKDIQGYEGLYRVSNLGRVKSLRSTHYNHKIKSTVVVKREKILALATDTKGYLRVCLHKNNKANTQKVHRLVASAFIENPNNYPCVNHKDENKQNNNVDNLEWCDSKYNCNYGTTQQRRADKTKKKVAQISKDGSIVKVWDSVNDASNDLNEDATQLSKWLNGRHKPRYIKDYTFKFVEKIDE